jgi:hypothetical protein
MSLFHLAHRRDVTGDGRLTERVRFLRAGLVTPLPGGLGIEPAGTMTGARGASLQARISAEVTPSHRVSREARPGLSHGIDLRGKRRGRSAERRAVPAGIASAPAALSGGNACECGADMVGCACRRSASLFYLEATAFVPFVRQSSDAFASRERDSISSAPAIAGEGDQP